VAANRLAPPGKSVAPEIGLALEQGLVLTTGQLRSAGYSASRIHRLVRRGRWTRCGPGVLTPIGLTQLESGDALEAELRKHCLRMAGALLRRPGHVAAGASVAILHGLPVLAVPDLPQLVAPAPATTGRRAGAAARRLPGGTGHLDRRRRYLAGDGGCALGLLRANPLNRPG
jgi:hypothetical protein